MDKLFGWILAGIAVPTCFANCLLIYVLRSERRLWTVTNQIIVSMAASDLAVGIITLPLRVLTTFLPQLMQYNAVCLAIHIASFFFSVASLYHLLAIAVERFCAIVYPLRHKTTFTPRVTRATILAVWAFPAIYAVAPFFKNQSAESSAMKYPLGKKPLAPKWTMNVTREACEISAGITDWHSNRTNVFLLNETLELNQSTPVCQYGRNIRCPIQSVMYLSIIIIFLIMLLLYLQIFWVALQQIQKINTANQSGSWTTSTFKKEIRAFVVSAIAVVWFFVTYSPLLARFVTICFLGQADKLDWKTILAIGLVYLNSTINPFIYGLLSRDIRTAIFHKVRKKLCPSRIHCAEIDPRSCRDHT